VRGAKARISAWLARPATERDREVARSLAVKLDQRVPMLDAPAYADAHDREAPAGLLNRSGMLATAFRFAAANGVEGDYLEFGTYRGATFRLAYRHATRLLERPIRFRLFDSFEGLPAAGELGRWEPGAYAATLDEVRAAARDEGIPDDAWEAVAGFYSDTLTPELASTVEREGTRAAVAWIDCDLYESARDVLGFLTPLVVPGTLLCFDDYYAFRGDPAQGEQRALSEWLDANPDLAAVPYLNFGWHGKSFLVATSAAS
jgi:O-methyltransferase